MDAIIMARNDTYPDSPLSEADIQAYADGILTPERAVQLRNYLGKDPVEARRVAFYGRLNAQIRQTFKETAEPMNERPMHGHPPGGQPAHSRAEHWVHTLIRLIGLRLRYRAVRYVFALIVVLVTASGWIAATQVSTRALNNAAVMALAETAGTPLPASSPTLASAAAPDLTAVGLRLVEERSVALGPLQRASEFIYMNGEGHPVVLFSSLAMIAPTQPQWMAHRIGDIRLLTWTNQQQHFVLAGDARTHGLMRAADQMTIRQP